MYFPFEIHLCIWFLLILLCSTWDQIALHYFNKNKEKKKTERKSLNWSSVAGCLPVKVLFVSRLASVFVCLNCFV